MPPVAADKRFRRAHVKPARKRKTSAFHWLRAARLAGLTAVALYAGWRGTALLLGATSFQVSRVLVRGNERLATGEVLAILEGLRGRNILTVGIDEWQQRLLASPWVEAATVRRMLPSQIEVTISERRPMAVARLGKSLYLVDATGNVIDEYGPTYADLDVPVVDGLAARPADGEGAVDVRRAALAARVISSLESRPDVAKRVSQIDVTDAHDAVVMLEGESTMLRLGDADFVDRIQGYLDLAPALRERVADIDYVDLRFGERLYVRPVKK
jgi:cell division septal protein FtsQ